MKKSLIFQGEYKGITFYEVFPTNNIDIVRIVRYAPSRKLLCILYHDGNKKVATGVTEKEWQSYCEQQSYGYLTNILSRHKKRTVNINA